MDFLFQFFYIIYPYISVIVLSPFYALLYVIDLINLMAGLHTVLHNAAYAALFSIGAVFLLQMTMRFVRTRKMRTPIRPLTWFALWLYLFIAYLLLFNTLVANLSHSTEYGPAAIIVLLFWAITLIGAGSLFYYIFLVFDAVILSRLALAKQNKPASLLVLSGLSLFALYPFLFVLIIGVEVFVQPLGNPQSTRFAVINAAIKNTCFMDPVRKNCPQTLEEISYIEPQYYKDLRTETQVSYNYYPDINLYTLVVRYSPTRAVIFDWRLTETTGVDFGEYEVALVGKDRIKNPPNFEGPWTFPEWDY